MKVPGWTKMGFKQRDHRRTSPVTIVTSVPWEREWDIMEKFSVMGTPSLQPFLKSYWLTPVQMTGQLSRSMLIMTSSRQYKCGACDNYVRIWYSMPISWTSSQGTKVTIVTGDVPLLSFHKTSQINSQLWERYSIPPWERLRAACTNIHQRDRIHIIPTNSGASLRPVCITHDEKHVLLRNTEYVELVLLFIYRLYICLIP